MLGYPEEQLQLKNVEKQLLHLQREARRQSKDQELCGLTPRSQLVCLAVYILSGFRLDVAEAFEALSTDIPTKIREWFRDCPLECLYHLQQPPASSEKNKSVHEAAAKYVAKWDTAAWVTQQNYICGVAPTYDALVHKYFQELDKRDLAHLSERLRVSAECGDGKAAVPGRTARAWCGRFCKQFAITRKRLGMSTGMPVAELEEKVRGFWHWVDYLRHLTVASGREPVFLNFDESSISQWWLQPKGCVVKRSRWKGGIAPRAPVPASRRRGAVTFGALVTHRTDLQPLLPQVVIGNR
eukprot:s616_g22.t1